MKILLVEDDDGCRIVIRMLLEMMLPGVDVTEAESGEAALDALETTAEVDTILLDIGLPGIDGWEVVRRLRARGDRTPIIVTTAWSSAPEHPDFTFCDGFVEKPVDRDVLVEAILRTVSKSGHKYVISAESNIHCLKCGRWIDDPIHRRYSNEEPR